MNKDKEAKNRRKLEKKANTGIWKILFSRFDQLKDFKAVIVKELRSGFFTAFFCYIIAGALICMLLTGFIPSGGIDKNIEWWKIHGYVTILVCCALGALSGIIFGSCVKVNVPYLKEDHFERGDFWDIKRIYTEYFRKANERQIESNFWAQRANAEKYSTAIELNKEFAGFRFLFVFTPLFAALSLFLFFYFAENFTDDPFRFILYSLSFGFTACWIVFVLMAGGISGCICKKCGKVGCMVLDEIKEEKIEKIEEREHDVFDETIGTVYVGNQAVGTVTQYHSGWTEQRTITEKYEKLNCHCICCQEKTSNKELMSKEKGEWHIK